MSDTNAVTISGRVGDEVEVKWTKGGTAWAKMSVAVSGGRGDKEWTNWLKIETWGSLAETCGTIKVGTTVLVQGELKNNVWVAKDGTGKRKETVIRADGVFVRPERVSGVSAIREPAQAAQGFLEAPREERVITSAPDIKPEEVAKLFEEDDIPF